MFTNNKRLAYNMKLRTLKIGQANITPKMLKPYIGALFIQGMGIGLAVASTGDSNSTYSPNLFILVCSIISIIMIFYSSSKKEKK
tara:strand:+ start:2207 stop:2461 length:255 start_codon:yes stop_codon:yes gene_type:complete